MLPVMKPPNIAKLDLSLDPTRNHERMRLVKERINRYEASFGSLDYDQSYSALFEMLWYSQMPCFDIKGLTSQVKDELSFLKRCYWKETQISCNQIFQKRPTEKGMCCSFNMKMLNEVLKDSRYKESITTRQSTDVVNGFEQSETVLRDTKLYKESTEPIPEAGRDKGLTLIVDGHSNKLSRSTISDNFRGFVTVVDGKEKFPLVSHSNLIVRPGFENEIKVNAIQVHTLSETRKYHPKKRNCYFPDEYKLEIHHFYSRPSCIFECETQFAAECLKSCDEMDFGKKCNCSSNSHSKNGFDKESMSCVPWFFPTNDLKQERMCNPWKKKKFLEIMKKQIPKDLCSHCLPDCTTTEYDTSISYADFNKCDQPIIGSTGILCDLINQPLNPSPWTHTATSVYKNSNKAIPWYMDILMINNGTNTTRFSDNRSKLKTNGKQSIWNDEQPYDAYKKDIGIVNIFFSKKEITKFVKSNRMSTYGFLAQIGGSLGFAMGISIISVVEFVYWFTLQLFRNSRSQHDGRGRGGSTVTMVTNLEVEGVI